MSSKKQELMELYDERLQIEKDTLRSGAVTASEKLPSAEDAIEMIKKHSADMKKTSRTEFLLNLQRYRSPKIPMDPGFFSRVQF